MSLQSGIGQPAEADQIKQFKEFLTTYNRITEECFASCINDFTTRKVLSDESRCSVHCLQKYLKATARISQRFQEHLQQTTNMGVQPGLSMPSS